MVVNCGGDTYDHLTYHISERSLQVQVSEILRRRYVILKTTERRVMGIRKSEVR